MEENRPDQTTGKAQLGGCPLAFLSFGYQSPLGPHLDSRVTNVVNTPRASGKPTAVTGERGLEKSQQCLQQEKRGGPYNLDKEWGQGSHGQMKVLCVGLGGTDVAVAPECLSISQAPRSPCARRTDMPS